MKKLLIVGAIAAVAVVGFKGTKVVREAVNAVRAHTQPTIEDQLADMRKEVAHLDGDVEKVKTDLAKEIVAVRELTTRTGDLRAGLESEKNTLVKRGEEIKDATERVKYGSTMLTPKDARDRLAKDVTVFGQKKKTLDSLESTLRQRETIKETLQKQLDAMISQKVQLVAEIDAVEADYKNVQLQQIESKYQTDDSKLARIKDRLREIRKGVDVEKVKLELTPQVVEERTSTEPALSVDDILAPLTGKSSK